MAKLPLRFLHASDLHLDVVPGGLAEVPDHLRSLLADAPYVAAERLFDVAIRERVDAVLLAGDVVDPARCGPRGLIFLVEQFNRLAEHNIRVYWLPGRTDLPQRWPALAAVPDTVHRFGTGEWQGAEHQRDGAPLLRVLALPAAPTDRLSTADIADGGTDVFTVAMLYGDVELGQLAGQPVHYWALGGKHRRRTLSPRKPVAHYPGTTQGRGSKEAGPHGATLVHVDDFDHPRLQFIATDAVRWHAETIAVPERTGRSAIQRLLEDRALALWNNGAGPELLVHWTLSGTSMLADSLRRGKLAAELLAALRSTFADKHAGLWSVAVEADRATPLPESLYAQETVLGEFLRSVRHFADEPRQDLHLERFLPERFRNGRLAAAASLDDAEERSAVLAEVALLGMDLLQAGEHPT